MGLVGSWSGEWYLINSVPVNTYNTIIVSVSYTGNGSSNAGGGVFSVSGCNDGTIRVVRLGYTGQDDWPTSFFSTQNKKLYMRGVCAWSASFIWY